MLKDELESAGVNMTKGLRNFKNNPLMYARFMESFVSNECADKAKSALEAGDVASADASIEELKKVADKFGMADVLDSIEKYAGTADADGKKSALEAVENNVKRVKAVLVH